MRPIQFTQIRSAAIRGKAADIVPAQHPRSPSVAISNASRAVHRRASRSRTRADQKSLARSAQQIRRVIRGCAGRFPVHTNACLPQLRTGAKAGRQAAYAAGAVRHAGAAVCKLSDASSSSQTPCAARHRDPSQSNGLRKLPGLYQRLEAVATSRWLSASAWQPHPLVMRACAAGFAHHAGYGEGRTGCQRHASHGVATIVVPVWINRWLSRRILPRLN